MGAGRVTSTKLCFRFHFVGANVVAPVFGCAPNQLENLSAMFFRRFNATGTEVNSVSTDKYVG